MSSEVSKGPEIQKEFDDAVKTVNEFTTAPSQDNLLDLYGLFKQAKVGDNNESEPGIFDFKGKAKWRAWDKNKGMPQDEAKQKYIKLAQELAKTHA